ncbi:MAG: hypothetical protein HQL72_10080 [Magnetococcales bacterium]|nr:hypothetical protein [Magnetococcales bacterium]
MGNQINNWPLRKMQTQWMTLTLVVTVMFGFTPASLHAQAAGEGQDGTQRLGHSVGQFMNSFLRELDTPETGQSSPEAEKRPSRPKPSSQTGRGGWTKREQQIYDPWGVTLKRERDPFRYDPWGATGDTRNLRRFADQDWSSGQNYYGVGLEPWSDPRYRMSHHPYNRDGPPPWGGTYQPYRSPPPPGYPYGGQQVDSGWNW